MTGGECEQRKQTLTFIGIACDFSDSFQVPKGNDRDRGRLPTNHSPAANAEK